MSGAYDNVSHERLLHNIKKLGLGHWILWVRSFLQGRSTRVKLPRFLSESIPTPIGIPQGSPISSILFLLFNAPLVRGYTLDLLRCEEYTRAFRWVDDVCVLARRHTAKFAPNKFELIHFSNPRIPLTTTAITTATTTPPPAQSQRPPSPSSSDIYEFRQTILPSPHTKYLSVWLDKYLDFTTHRNKAPRGRITNGDAEDLPSGGHTAALLGPNRLVQPSEWECSSDRAVASDQEFHKNPKMCGADDQRRLTSNYY
ncbi:uncharacterized protein N7498_009071 [Penicillium cinerascens]|uniref:Reverse transcriptase domain-containing protein n=1 Tax=Penicillium cinerascens TaxID=70096 RepID=A0A9W9JEY3_9EURO|nr:uncharacterized protein N7498_009071 [Penicillium cinerascens]KAJ5195633.1 hypothetical protein N7498_009071 [Penicillium cinerascens]